MDITDAYHRGTLRTSQVGSFVYAVPSSATDDCVIICIDLVIPMGWVESPKYFCTFSETITDVANTLVNMSLPVLGYGGISKISETVPGLP